MTYEYLPLIAALLFLAACACLLVLAVALVNRAGAALATCCRDGGKRALPAWQRLARAAQTWA